MKNPRIVLIAAPGSCGEAEIEAGLRLVGAQAERRTWDDFKAGRAKLLDYGLCIIPGGSTYSDHLGAGKIMAVQMRHHIKDIKTFVRLKRPLLGIGNGFQALVKSGVLPFSGSGEHSVSFAPNENGRFETRWVHIRLNLQSSCPFFEGLPEMIELPVAHGEGRIVLKSPAHLEQLKRNRAIAMQYVSDDGRFLGYPHNPNGSAFNIAALSNPDGNCLGMMPHPERFTTTYQHPNWTRQTFFKQCAGLEILRNAARLCK